MLGLALTAGVTLVAAGYNTMAPRSQLYGRTFIGNGAGSRQLALTFDDGPNDPHTFRLLEILAKHGVKATFFPIGRFVEQRPGIVEAVAREGHAIGNHTYSHPLLIFKSAATLRDEISRCERVLNGAVGNRHLPLFRPPHGGRTPYTIRALRHLGMTPVMWSVSGWDWNATSAEQIERKVALQVRGGDVILLHDGGHQHMGVDRSHSVRAADGIVQRYKSAGYEFTTVAEMIRLAQAHG